MFAPVEVCQLFPFHCIDPVHKALGLFSVLPVTSNSDKALLQSPENFCSRQVVDYEEGEEEGSKDHCPHGSCAPDNHAGLMTCILTDFGGLLK